MSVDIKVPEIRYKGFSGKWERLSFLDSIERIIDFRGRTPKKLGLDWSPSGYRALSALNVKQGYIDFLTDPHFGDQELYDKWMSGSELHQGQVLFTTEAPMGNVAQVPNTDKYILSQRTIAFIVKSEIIAEDFLAVLLRSSKVFRELSALSSGGTAKGVSQKVLANLSVSIPNDLVEQATIGNYFQKLDALINQHQQKHDKLSSIKKAMLEKMFPKQYESIPEIRFKGFGEEWEVKKLGEIGSFSSGVGFSESEQSGKSGIPFFKVSDMNLMGNDCYMASANNYVNDEQILRLNYTPIHENSILFAKVGAAIFLERKRIAKDFLIDNNMMAFSPNQEIIFMKQWFDSISLSKHTQVGALPSLKASDLEKIKLKIPKRKEQIKIGNYFQKLDSLIDRHQQQITKLNNIKQACLSKMFV